MPRPVGQGLSHGLAGGAEEVRLFRAHEGDGIDVRCEVYDETPEIATHGLVAGLGFVGLRSLDDAEAHGDVVLDVHH